MKNGCGKIVFQASPKLWTPDTPICYEVKIEFGEDCIRDEIGFRRISVEGDTICLNGEPIFLKGISCHEESVPNGKACR